MNSIMSTPMSNQQQMSQPVQNEYNDAITQAISLAQNGVNLENEFKHQIAKYPNRAQEFAQFMQQNKYRNLWDIVYELMAKRGVNPATFGLPPRK